MSFPRPNPSRLHNQAFVTSHNSWEGPLIISYWKNVHILTMDLSATKSLSDTRQYQQPVSHSKSRMLGPRKFTEATLLWSRLSHEAYQHGEVSYGRLVESFAFVKEQDAEDLDPNRAVHRYWGFELPIEPVRAKSQGHFPKTRAQNIGMPDRFKRAVNSLHLLFLRIPTRRVRAVVAAVAAHHGRRIARRW
jgi:hypothetical protein